MGGLAGQIVLYKDEVSFGGKLVGGIRARAPKNQPLVKLVRKPAPAPVEQENGEEETPY